MHIHAACVPLVIALAIILVLFIVGMAVTFYDKDKKINQPKAVQKSATGKTIKHDNLYLQKYYEALEAKDRDAMMAALIECKEHCSGANSWCLTEMFCPECPMGGLPVCSGRGEYSN